MLVGFSGLLAGDAMRRNGGHVKRFEFISGCIPLRPYAPWAYITHNAGDGKDTFITVHLTVSVAGIGAQSTS